MTIAPEDRVLFTGDSVTDCGRARDNLDSLGYGYVSVVAGMLQPRFAGVTVLNLGISGNQVSHLLERLQPDLLDLQPTVVSILVGINETWRRYDSNQPTSTRVYEDNYRALLEKIRAKLTARLVLMEPFVVHVPDDRHTWREDLNPRIDAVRRLAVEFGADLVPLDGIFAQACTRAPAAYWAADGVHPTPAGHGLIAQAWLANADLI